MRSVVTLSVLIAWSSTTSSLMGQDNAVVKGGRLERIPTLYLAFSFDETQQTLKFHMDEARVIHRRQPAAQDTGKECWIDPCPPQGGDDEKQTPDRETRMQWAVLAAPTAETVSPAHRPLLEGIGTRVLATNDREVKRPQDFTWRKDSLLMWVIGPPESRVMFSEVDDPERVRVNYALQAPVEWKTPSATMNCWPLTVYDPATRVQAVRLVPSIDPIVEPSGCWAPCPDSKPGDDE